MPPGPSVVLLWAVLTPTLAGMKASQSLLSFALAILLSSTGWARIGETIDQCGVRYGDPFKEDAELVGFPDSTALFYRKSGLMMIVGFWRGKAVILTIGRPTGSGSSEQLSDVEVETLLAANAPGKWKKLEPLAAGFGSEGWISEDGKVWAKQEKLTTNPTLQIMTKEYIDAQNAAKAAKDKKNLDGF